MNTPSGCQNQNAPYEAALEAALTDLERAQALECDAQNQLAAMGARVAELAHLVQTLVAILPRDRKAFYSQRLASSGAIKTVSSRGGQVFDKVVDLFNRRPRKEWTASDVQTALADTGKRADSKAIYNVLNYLTKTGRLKRIGRGHYLVVDVGVSFQVGHDLESVDAHGGGCMEN